MHRSLRHLRPRAAARRIVVVLAPILFVAGCAGSKTLAEHAAESAVGIATAQGLTIQSVSCSPRGEVSWTCTGRLQSGRQFTCSVGPVGRVSASGTCMARADRP
jgi:hypothetical protein